MKLGSRLKKTDDAEDQRRSVLYWGKAKTGKTHNLLSWPKPLVVYWDRNLDTVLKHHGVDYVIPDSFADFQQHIMPELLERKLEHETIGMDSYSFMANLLREELQGRNEKLTIQQWGVLFDRLMQVTNQLTGLTTGQGRTYHVVATVHERAQMDDDGNLVEYSAAIQGQFRDWLPRFFNTVLLTDVRMKPTLEVVGGKKVPVKVPEYFVHSVPPNKYWVAGDGLGGGKFKVLPPQLPGTYTSLTRAWGIEE